MFKAGQTAVLIPKINPDDSWKWPWGLKQHKGKRCLITEVDPYMAHITVCNRYFRVSLSLLRPLQQNSFFNL